MSVEQIPNQLRKLAKELREKADETKKRNVIKCAQVLVAAQGFDKLAQIINGEGK